MKFLTSVKSATAHSAHCNSSAENMMDGGVGSYQGEEIQLRPTMLLQLQKIFQNAFLNVSLLILTPIFYSTQAKMESSISVEILRPSLRTKWRARGERSSISEGPHDDGLVVSAHGD